MRRAVKNWPTTLGIITSSEAESESMSPVKGEVQVKQRVIIAYEYYVSDKTYQSEHMLSFSEPSLAIADQYHKGQRVRVYYHPKDPATSRLFPSTNISGTLFLLLFGALTLFVGIAGRERQSA